MVNRICMIATHFGSLPFYFKLFANSCGFNKQIDFIFFTDVSKPDDIDIPENITYFHTTLEELEGLIAKKTKVPCRIEKPINLVDYKPAFGLIFEDYISQYEFWGHCDTDIILGDLSAFLNQSFLSKYDIISCRKHWMSGHFVLYRNIPDVNLLFSKSRDWKKVFQELPPNHFYFGFEEAGIVLPEKGTNPVFYLLESGKSIYDLETNIESFTHLVKNENLPLRIFMEDLVIEDLNPGMMLKYCDGQISLFKSGQSKFRNGRQFMYLHFVNVKWKPYFSFPRWESIPREYYIDNSGFYNEKELKYSKVLYISRRIQGPFIASAKKMRKLLERIKVSLLFYGQ